MWHQLRHLPSPTHLWTFEMERVPILRHIVVLLVTEKSEWMEAHCQPTEAAVNLRRERRS